MAKAKKKKQAPCTKWMHHKWLPKKAELMINEDLCFVCGKESCDCPPTFLYETKAGFAEQTCCFCQDKRKVKLEVVGETEGDE